jgi:hypothetical protein
VLSTRQRILAASERDGFATDSDLRSDGAVRLLAKHRRNHARHKRRVGRRYETALGKLIGNFPQWLSISL